MCRKFINILIVIVFFIPVLFVCFKGLAASLVLASDQESYSHEEIIVETLSAKCMSGETVPFDVRVEEKSIIITQSLIASTPCHEVKGTVKVIKNDIVVRLWTERIGDVCTMCIGKIVGKITIPNLAKGTYSVKVSTQQGESVASVKIE